ncbi:MAG: GerAB/ArcD/ProY family transporter [Thermicanus sp.]|nr:GerAB/ArcD/ProY family transporter [Thermicanus sp.]
MNRYLLYLIIVNVLMNGVGYVPRILFEDRHQGTTISIALAILTGNLLLYGTVWLFSRFPHQGLPELMEQYTPTWFRIPILLFYTLYWAYLGMNTLLILTDASIRYLNTESSDLLTLSLYIILVLFFIRLPSEKLLFGVEILTILVLPNAFLLIFIALTHNELLWDAMMAVATHLDPPTWSAFNVANYSLSGYTHLIIFNRVFSIPRRTLIQYLFMGLLFSFSFLVIYFLPIGLLGEEGVGLYAYPWIATADTLRMPLGPIERALFPFFMAYILMALIITLVHWHVVLNLIRSLIGLKNLQKKNTLRHLPILFLILFGYLLYLFYERFHERDFYLLGKNMFNVFFPTQLSIILVLFWIYHRVRKED